MEKILFKLTLLIGAICIVVGCSSKKASEEEEEIYGEPLQLSEQTAPVVPQAAKQRSQPQQTQAQQPVVIFYKLPDTPPPSKAATNKNKQHKFTDDEIRDLNRDNRVKEEQDKIQAIQGQIKDMQDPKKSAASQKPALSDVEIIRQLEATEAAEAAAKAAKEAQQQIDLEIQNQLEQEQNSTENTPPPQASAT